MGIVLHGIFDKSPTHKTTAIIPAAGCGKRMGIGFNKLFLSINDKPILAYTLDAFELCNKISEIIIVASPNEVEMIEDIVEDFGYRKVTNIVIGGATRQESVIRGFNAISEDTEIVLIHDAARPLVTNDEISDTIDAALKNGIACSGISPTDTVKKINSDVFCGTSDRNQLFLVRTPQTFKKDILQDVLRKSTECGYTATDESTLAEMCGYNVTAVKGKSTNIKLTVQEDFLLISAYILSEEKLN
ncbi:MAG: 2-C-methyl-D-erythritol 4-phosphate cytidylyltransferase [Clostridia bacterium]|nr:2-C-methyl-D-erythritol 4-phosphate cytidylyltransferase [Clostridia bacterium]